MASLQTNISKGAIRVSDTLIIGGYAETCNICNTYLSSDGCTNSSCTAFRGESMIGLALRTSYYARITLARICGFPNPTEKECN